MKLNGNKILITGATSGIGEALLNTFILAFKKDYYEINIGKVKLLKIINRISPALADYIMKSSMTKTSHSEMIVIARFHLT